MIKIENLTKSFAGRAVVDGLSFEVRPGEVLGFLGPNGAGKSTTMKMLTGFLRPTSGLIEVLGYNVAKQPRKVQALIGYLPEGAPAYGDMSVAGFLEFVGRARGLKGELLQKRLAEVTAQVELQAVQHQPIETLSKGFKRRVGLAQAIIHEPRVLVLDEPTDGLDPNQKHQVRLLIRNLAQDRIVIISTHILEEVDAVCSRALIIADGRIVADGTPASLASRSRFHQAVSLRFTQEYHALPLLQQLPLIADIEESADGRGFTLFPQPGAAILHSVNHLIHEQNWDVEELHVEKGRLDDVFRHVTSIPVQSREHSVQNQDGAGETAV